MKSDALTAWLEWRERFKNMTEEEKQEWDNDIEELNRQRYRPYLNDVDKIIIKNTLADIHTICEISIEKNNQVSLKEIKDKTNLILKTLELKKFTE